MREIMYKMKIWEDQFIVEKDSEVQLTNKCRLIKLKAVTNPKIIFDFVTLQFRWAFRNLLPIECFENIVAFDNINAFEFTLLSHSLFKDITCVHYESYRLLEDSKIENLWGDTLDIDEEVIEKWEKRFDSKRYRTSENERKLNEALYRMENEHDGYFTFRTLDKDMLALFKRDNNLDHCPFPLGDMCKKYAGKSVLLFDAVADCDESGISPNARLFEYMIDIKETIFMTGINS